MWRGLLSKRILILKTRTWRSYMYVVRGQYKQQYKHSSCNLKQKTTSHEKWKEIWYRHKKRQVMWAIVTTERPSSVRPSVRPLTFHILINSSEATGPIWTKLWWNGPPWMAPFQNCVRWSRLPTKMATKLKIEKRRMKF